MVQSMTGFGRGTAANDRYKITVELKSVNNRYLEVALHAPRLLLTLEGSIKKAIGGVAERGKVDVYIQLEVIGDAEPCLKTDKALAAAYAGAISEVADAAGIKAYQLTIGDLLRLPGLFTLQPPEDDLTAAETALMQALDEALAGLAAMRRSEGERLACDLLARRDRVASLVSRIEALSADVAKDYQAKLKARIEELLGAMPLDEARLANEVAYFADHACINEELVRLQSHLTQLGELLQSDDPCGRKLDFLLQEFNREVNTIGSKANCLEISQLVIEAKSELEKIREQIQNIE